MFPIFLGKLYKTALERRRQLTIFFVAWLFDIDDLDVVSELVLDCSDFEMSFFSNSKPPTQVQNNPHEFVSYSNSTRLLSWFDLLPWQKLERIRRHHFHFWSEQYQAGTLLCHCSYGIYKCHFFRLITSLLLRNFQYSCYVREFVWCITL